MATEMNKLVCLVCPDIIPPLNWCKDIHSTEPGNFLSDTTNGFNVLSPGFEHRAPHIDLPFHHKARDPK